MKRISILLATVAIILAGCSKDETNDVTGDRLVAFEEGQTVTIKASMDNKNVRATTNFDGTNIKTAWEIGNVALVTVGGKSGNFTVKSIDASGNATLAGTMPATGTTFTIQYPASTPNLSEQTYSPTEALPKNTMLYKSGECSLDGTASLEAQYSVLVLNLYGTDITVGKIVVKKGADTYNLNCGTGKTIGTTTADATPFCIVVPSGNYVFDAKVYDNASTPTELASFTPSSAQSFNVGQYVNMPWKEVKKKEAEYFYFEAKSDDVTFSLKEYGTDTPEVSLSWSSDKETWTSLSVGTAITVINGTKMFVKATSDTNSAFCNIDIEGNLNFYYFETTGQVDVGGNIMTLLNGTNPSNAVMGDNCFAYLFVGSTIVDASKLELPAKTLTMACYYSMFYQCEKLTKAPELPATTLAPYCYYVMFAGCKSLNDIPEKLPATKMEQSCYTAMFELCESIISVPSNYLPSTELAEGCYSYMFEGCKGLETSPVLPASKLVKECYYQMFMDCSKISEVTMCGTDGLDSEDCLLQWLENAGSAVSTDKKLYVDPAMTSNTVIDSNKGLFTVVAKP